MNLVVLSLSYHIIITMFSFNVFLFLFFLSDVHHNPPSIRILRPIIISHRPSLLSASFLSSPHTAAPLPRLPLATPGVLTQTVNPPPEPNTLQLNRKDPLLKLRIETELKREMRENIAHQRMIGSYVGRRHAMGLPVRGQNTQNNAKNAKKFNRVERYR